MGSCFLFKQKNIVIKMNRYIQYGYMKVFTFSHKQYKVKKVKSKCKANTSNNEVSSFYLFIKNFFRNDNKPAIASSGPTQVNLYFSLCDLKK